MTTTLEHTTDTTGTPRPASSTARSAPEATQTDIRPRRRTYGPGGHLTAGRGLGVLVLLLAWVAGSATGLIDPRVLASPWQVVVAAADLVESGRLQESLLASLTRAGVGTALGIVAGVLLATVAGLSRWGESLIDGPVQVKRSIPTLALMPLLILWFGIGEEMKITTIALATVIPVYMNTFDGLRSIDRRFVELASTLEVGRLEFLRRVILPGAMPGVILGLRYGVTAGLLALVVVEQVNTTSGLGYMITLASNYGQTEIIVVGLVTYAVLGVTADAVLRAVGRRALSWRRTIS
ncbi:ABC transporter permease [Corynebacterium sp. USCH3]|uniref:ABC transporter permease n=1 Tax=Corynebacterium sp. USCH3 TaxID=3024840 RepID=UPI0030AB31BB